MCTLYVDPDAANLRYGLVECEYIVSDGELIPLYGNNCTKCTNIGESIHQLKREKCYF